MIPEQLDLLSWRAPSSRWVTRDCLNCGKSFTRHAKHCDRPRSRGVYCSGSCSTSATNRARKGTGWTHRGLPGALNPNWKGGVSRDHYRYKLRFATKFPEKVAAHNAVAVAKRKGLLKPEPCHECGTTERVHAHHHDYSKPLEVTWICQPCHNRHHHLGVRRAA